MPPIAKAKVNWLQVAAIVLPLLITGITGWIAVQVRLARMEQFETKYQDLKGEIQHLKAELSSHIEKEQEKRSAMWQAISKKKDKPNAE